MLHTHLRGASHRPQCHPTVRPYFSKTWLLILKFLFEPSSCLTPCLGRNSRSTKVQASRIAFTPAVFLAVIRWVGHVWRCHDLLDRSRAPSPSLCTWSHCSDLDDCWTAFCQNNDVLIAPVIVSYPRVAAKPRLLIIFLLRLLVTPLGLRQHQLIELAHLAMKILMSYSVMSCASIVTYQEPVDRIRGLRDLPLQHGHGLRAFSGIQSQFGCPQLSFYFLDSQHLHLPVGHTLAGSLIVGWVSSCSPCR